MGKEQLSDALSRKAVRSADSVIANHPDSQVFRDARGRIVTLPTREFRHDALGRPTDGVTEHDLTTLPFFHPDRRDQQIPPESSARLAKNILASWRIQPDVDNTVGIEVEGNLYKATRGGVVLAPKYDGVHYSAANDLHPEKVDSMIEVATNAKNGHYPATPVEIAHRLAEALEHGLEIADKRGGLFVIASGPEGGDSSQIRLTEHPYIQNAANKASDVPWEDQDIPNQTKRIIRQTNLGPIVAVDATHIHTSVPTIKTPEYSEFLDPRIALAKAQLRHTRLAKLLDFMLFNTKDYLGQRFDNVQDTRSYLRRNYPGARDGQFPHDAYDFFEQALQDLMEGKIPAVSRFPSTGQHDRTRMKGEFGTVETVNYPAHPDVRFLLGAAFANQILDVFALEAIAGTEGQETEVLPYLQKLYGPLFEEIPTSKGPENTDTTYTMDQQFNENKFEGSGVDGVSFGTHMQEIRYHIKRIGGEYKALRTQAIVVDHLIDNTGKDPYGKPDPDGYMNLEEKMRNGIFTDHLTDDIDINVRARAKGTRKQAPMLGQVKTDNDILKLVGVPYTIIDWDRRRTSIG